MIGSTAGGTFEKARRFVSRNFRGLALDWRAKAASPRSGNGADGAAASRRQEAVQQWRLRGGDFAAAGKIAEAIDCRRRAVELDPDNVQVRMELVRELVLAGRREEAEGADAGMARVWRMLGADFLHHGQRELGLNCWRRAADLDPADAQVRLDLIKELRADGRSEQVSELLSALDVKSTHKSYDRRYYKDFTEEEKYTLLEAGLITIASPEAIIELTRAVNYVLGSDIPGAFVECGVFQGGNAVVMIRTLLNAGITDRDIYLYDTFEGFPKPEEIDFEYLVGPALETWQRYKRDGDESVDKSEWLRFPLEKVRERVLSLGYPESRIRFVKGLVEDTIPGVAPDTIALLRLDTDFYRSTKHELIHLYPRLRPGGILIIDDYGALHGCRVATDEYLRENGIRFFPGRVDEHVRIGVKIESGFAAGA